MPAGLEDPYELFDRSFGTPKMRYDEIADGGVE